MRAESAHKLARAQRLHRDAPLPSTITPASASAEEQTPLVDRLGAADPADRAWACVSAAHILLHASPKARRALLHRGLLMAALVPCLRDAEASVAVEALNALRCLALTGGADAVADIVHKGKALVPIATHVLQRLNASISSMLQRGKQAEAGEMDAETTWTMALRVLHLLHHLCDANPAIRAVIFQEHPDLVAFTLDVALAGQESQDSVPGNVALAAAHALDVLIVPCTIQTRNEFAARGSAARDSVREWINTESGRLAGLVRCLGIALKPSELEQTNGNMEVEVSNGSAVKQARHNNRLEKQIEDARDRSFAQVMIAGLTWRLRKYIARSQNISDRKAALQEIHARVQHVLTSSVVASAASTILTSATTVIASSVPSTVASTEQDMTDGDTLEIDPTESDKDAPLRDIERRCLRVQVLLEILADILAKGGVNTSDGLPAADESAAKNDASDSDADDAGWEDQEDENDTTEPLMDDEDDDDNDAENEAESEAEKNDEEHLADLEALRENGAGDTDMWASRMLAEQRDDGQEMSNLLRSLVQLATPSLLDQPLSEAEIVDARSDAMRAIHGLHVRAAGCLTNLLLPWSMSSPDATSASWLTAATVAELWNWVLATVERVAVAAVNSGSPANVELLDSMTSIAWTLSRGTRGQLDVSDAVVNGWIQLFDSLSARILSTSEGGEDPVAAKMLGLLGSLAQPHPGHIERNRAIGRVLLSAAEQHLKAAQQQGGAIASGACLAEALDAVFDVYDDAAKDYDLTVFVQEGFLARLNAMVMDVKRATRRVDKRRHAELRQRMDAAAANLSAFVRYKTQEARTAYGTR